MVALPASGASKREAGDEVAKLREQVKRLKSNKGGSGGKAQGKGKQSKGRKNPSIPAELVRLNCVATVNGARACYAFNLQGCGNGGDCPKGVHKCMAMVALPASGA
eukprot:2178428-Karenia_brevis.AAC.1